MKRKYAVEFIQVVKKSIVYNVEAETNEGAIKFAQDNYLSLSPADAEEKVVEDYVAANTLDLSME